MAFEDKKLTVKGGEVDKKIAAALEEKSAAGEISCADAESVSRGLNVEMGEVGRTLDILGIRIVRCQLGLFGYGEKKKVVTAAETVAPEFREAIRNALVGGSLPCAASWDIARRSSVPKMAVSSACEAMDLKIKPCQLGAF